ncbi:MAG: hypothetical protein QNK05_21980 [Myxococcota bacterium]|nr:hypothetical protein [Myxococcota bacterium]
MLRPPSARPKSLRRLASALLLVAFSAAPAWSQKRDVDLGAVWKPIDGVYLIHADPATQVLVFPGGEFVLDGAGLDLFAGTIRLEGHTVIRSHAPGAQPEPVTGAGRPGRTGRSGKGYAPVPVGALSAVWKDKHGARGRPGENGGKGLSGQDGLSGSRVTLRIEKIVGDGKLTVLNGGTRGGSGQQGGPGGHGGDGARGRDAGRSAACKSAASSGDGGKGGRGGSGGDGGDGGRGGNGGPVVYTANLAPYLQSGQVTLRSPGGRAGKGGIGGLPGAGGTGGQGGKQSKCGPGGDVGEAGPDGLPGVDGANGVEGKPGGIVVIPVAEG